MSTLTVAAVDLGAESGRVGAAQFDGSRLSLNIHHRFPHQPSVVDGWLRWDIDGLWREVSDGLSSLAASTQIASVGVDTWGLDYGLYGNEGRLLEAPTAYRDKHRIDVFSEIVSAVGASTIYDATGTQLMEINSLFGLATDARLRPKLLDRARSMLMMPDVFHRLLSGSTVTEFSAASTTGMYDMKAGRWATELLERVDVPVGILPDVVSSGTDVGPVIGQLAVGGLAETRVILPAAHDTASAVLAIPDASPETLFISSGTWSLVGVVLDSPVVTAASQQANLTNEGGYNGTVRFLRNVMGLWVLQECRREWERDGLSVDYDTLITRAAAEVPLVSLINPNATEFLTPGDMPRRIQDYCRVHAIPVPETIGQIARTVFDSLALSYRLTAEDIAAVTGVPLTSVAVVGGGGQNALLQQATADATGLPVVCWAKEATALGNAASQLRAVGEIGSIEQIWEVVRASTQTHSFEPRSDGRWSDAAEKLRGLERAESRRRGLEEPNATSFAHQDVRATWPRTAQKEATQ
ncbi:rhamnulokinase [Leifsonia sp. A12D58]|uniref:rhamnulokinase n=1 Tax=Leifsonia sp. A12D58 TaxID=3397674 RepID=UPI0039E0F9BD